MKNKWKYYQKRFEHEQEIDDRYEGWYGLRRFGYDLVSYIKPQIIVELGTYKGTSYCAFAQAIKDNKLSTQLVGVDTWQGDEHTGYYSQNVYKNLKTLLNNHYKNIKTKLIRSTFDTALSKFKVKSIDILHIDGLHTYDAVKHDFTTWKDKVKDDGIIIFHDIHYKKRGFGVFRFWNEIKNEYMTLELKHSNGLGILIKDRNVFQHLKPLETSWQVYYSTKSELDFLMGNESENEKNLLASYDNRIQEMEKNLDKQIDLSNSLVEQLNSIKKSKFFKLWQKYCDIRDAILKKYK